MITVEAGLVGSGTPRAVQVVVSGVPAGRPYVVEGVADEYVWPVRGGRGVSSGAPVILGDNRAPLNRSVMYRVTVDGAATLSAPLIVSYDGRHVLQSVDGQLSATSRLMSNGLPRDMDLRTAAFAVPRRARPVVRYDSTGDGGGQVVLDTTGLQTREMYDLLASGQPIVIRTDGAVRDMAPVEVVMVTAAPSVLTDARIQAGDTRRWTLSYILVDDPDPDAIVATSLWSDFNSVYVGRTWSSFNAEWAGRTWSDFNREDWEGRL